MRSQSQNAPDHTASDAKASLNRGRTISALIRAISDGDVTAARRLERIVTNTATQSITHN